MELITAIKSLVVVQAPEVDLIKLFWPKFTCSFCKLDLFIVMQQTLLIFIKWSSLPKSASKLTPK
jgi:hypothetical protein